MRGCQEGVAAYRAKDYPRAIERFSASAVPKPRQPRQRPGEGRRYDDAIAATTSAALQPGMKDAEFNRNLVRLAQKLPPQQDRRQAGRQGHANMARTKRAQEGRARTKASRANSRDNIRRNPDRRSRRAPRRRASRDRRRKRTPLSASDATGVARTAGEQSANASTDSSRRKRRRAAKPRKPPKQRERSLATRPGCSACRMTACTCCARGFLLEQQRRRGARLESRLVVAWLGCWQ